jgi:DNA gyrase/topoisomerase IV subunit B
MAKDLRSAEYNATSIDILSDAEHVRLRTGMYLGGKDEKGAYKACDEIVDNCVDEHLAGHGNLIRILYDLKSGFITVADRGRGIPVDIHPKTHESALTSALTRLKAGGKFKGGEGSYVQAGGLNGVGASCTNAVSDSLEAWSYRNKIWNYQKFSKGVPVTKLIKRDPDPVWATAKCGTIIRFHLDPEIFGTATVSPKRLLVEMRDKAFLNPGLELQVVIGGKSFRFASEHGLLSMVFDPKRKESMLGKPWRLFDKGLIDTAVCWYDDDDAMIKSYVNSIHTDSNGTHVDGFKMALTQAMRELSGTDYEPKYWMKGMMLALNWRMENPDFHGQTKGELSSPIASKVRDLIYPKLSLWLKQNPALVKRLADRAAAFKKNEDKFKADNKAIKALEVGGKDDRGIDPSKLIQADPSVPPHLRELVLVEGNSAGGTCVIDKTLIALINGKTKTIKQLTKDHAKGIKNYGYAFDQSNHRVRAVELEAPRVTKQVTELIEVEFANGKKERCTPDHLWLTASGKYIRADEIDENTLLMPFIEGVYENRRFVLSPKPTINGRTAERGRCDFVFKTAFELNKTEVKIAKSLRSKGRTVQIHHKDHDSTNDSPDNLVALDEVEHLKHHGERTRFSTETVSGELNGHTRRMKSDPEYHKATVARTTEVFGKYWRDPKHRKENSVLRKKYFSDPANVEKTRQANRQKVIGTYAEIVRRCKHFDESTFNEQRQILATELGVKRINIRWDYWQKLNYDSISTFKKEI